MLWDTSLLTCHHWVQLHIDWRWVSHHAVRWIGTHIQEFQIVSTLVPLHMVAIWTWTRHFCRFSMRKIDRMETFFRTPEMFALFLQSITIWWTLFGNVCARTNDTRSRSECIRQAGTGCCVHWVHEAILMVLKEKEVVWCTTLNLLEPDS